MKRKSIYILLIAVFAGLFVYYLYPRPKGFIKIETSGVEMLISKGFFQNVKVTSSDTPAKVTVGTYRPKNIFIRAEKDKDKWWTVYSHSGPWGQLSKITVEKDKTTTLTLGFPFTIKTDVQKTSGYVSIGLTLVGRSGENWNTQVLSYKGAVMSPKLTIMDEAGKILASGNFQYG